MGKFGKEIGAYLSTYAMNAETLALLVGVRRIDVTKWMSGGARPNDAELLRIALIFGVDYDRLVDLRETDIVEGKATSAYNTLISLVRKLSPEEAISLCDEFQSSKKEETFDA